MIAGGNWWRANEIVMHHLTGQSDTRYRSRDNALLRSATGLHLRCDVDGAHIRLAAKHDPV
jgi:hypothetical protein